MGSVLRSFGAFQGNIWSVAPFIPVGLGENRWKKHKKIFHSKPPQCPILKFCGVNVVILNWKLGLTDHPGNFFVWGSVKARCDNDIDHLINLEVKWQLYVRAVLRVPADGRQAQNDNEPLSSEIQPFFLVDRNADCGDSFRPFLTPKGPQPSNGNCSGFQTDVQGET